MTAPILSPIQFPGTLSGTSDGFTPIGHGLEVSIPVGAVNGDSWELDILPFATPQPLAATALSEEIFISSRTELLSLISGNLVHCNNSDSGTFDFRGQSRASLDFRSDKIATFYNHIFLARGRTLWWTDLDNYWNWFPAVESEADFRTLEWERQDITAIVLLNDVLFIHFPEAIYDCVYVGKPTIVRITKRITGSGAINQRSCITTKSAMFFLGVENFYVWSIDRGLSEIGQEVYKQFLATSVDLMDTWAYHDLVNHEICWVNNGLIWAFNYVEGHWCKYSAENILSHCSTPWLNSPSYIYSAGSGSTIEPDKAKGVENLWVTGQGVVRDMRAGDALAWVRTMEMPFLETDDLTYGDIHSVKGADLVLLDMETERPWTGFQVFVAGKRRVTAATNWEDCGMYLEGAPHRDFPSVDGHALRFRFELREDVSKFDGGYTLNGAQQLDGKHVDRYDGYVLLDGSHTMRGEEYYAESADAVHWRAQLYAWGHRVNLPERLVGPDK